MNSKSEVVLVVLNNFKNDSRVLKEACSLQKNGYSVKVVALYEESLKEYELVENISVHRLKTFKNKSSRNKIVQGFRYLDFYLRFIIKHRKCQFIHCNDLETLPLGGILKIFFNKKLFVIYDAHEYEINHGANPSKFKTNLLYVIEKLFINFADRVMTVSDSIANEYARLYGIEKPTLVLNCPFYQSVSKQDLFRNEFAIHKDQRIFLYQGCLDPGRGIEMLLEVFSKMENDQNVCVFMGYGSLENEIKSKARKYKNIFFKNAVSPNLILEYTASADFGLCFIEPVSISYKYCLPNKLFEYLMAGIPILTVRDLVEVSQVVEAYGVGLVANSYSVDDVRDVIEKMEKYDYDSFASRIQEARKIFTWEVQEKSLLGVYSNTN